MNLKWMFKFRYWYHCRVNKEPMPYEEWKSLMIDCNYTVWNTICWTWLRPLWEKGWIKDDEIIITRR
jgi:hypothetical protein